MPDETPEELPFGGMVWESPRWTVCMSLLLTCQFACARPRQRGAEFAQIRIGQQLAHGLFMGFRLDGKRLGQAVKELVRLSIIGHGNDAKGSYRFRSRAGGRDGATFVEDWRRALSVRPAFLQVHRFQEFAGQPVGRPSVYVDVYSPPLSDDLVPTSLTAPAYRRPWVHGARGGWGCFYLNLLRALVDLYRQPQRETTVVAVSQPLRGECPTSTGKQSTVGPTSVVPSWAGMYVEDDAMHQDGVALPGPPSVSVRSLLET
jgi:hypothetical protein